MFCFFLCGTVLRNSNLVVLFWAWSHTIMDTPKQFSALAIFPKLHLYFSLIYHANSYKEILPSKICHFITGRSTIPIHLNRKLTNLHLTAHTMQL